MKRKYSREARRRMAAGGRSASGAVKSKSGRKGFEALIKNTVVAALAAAQPAKT